MTLQLPLSVLRRIDAACDDFELAWRRGEQPRIEDYVRFADSVACSHLLNALQQLQQELILKHLPSAPALSGLKHEDPDTNLQPVPVDEATIIWQPANVSLQVIAGPHEGEVFQYGNHDTLLAGRSRQAQLRLHQDRYFSRHHFRLEVNPPTCFLMDLHSRNGTLVNGERVAERFLQHGDIISGGQTKIAVSIHPNSSSDAAASVPAATVRPAKGRTADGSTQSSRRIKGYELNQEIGRGDLGTVYRATRLATGERCALKIISAEAHADERATQTFLREAAILKQLQHDHIVRLIELGAQDNDVYFSTEFVDAVPWPRLLERSTVARRVRLACGIMCQVLGALQYAHTRSLVHRDVKPANILIARKDGRLTAKLADFGVAKQYTSAGMSQITREGDVIGSLPFMSPEQLINSREAKPSCDIYSAGATLYWMLTGFEPILLENHPCKFLAILEEAPIPLQERCPEIPDGLAKIVHQALEKTAARRFQSCGEMRLQLRSFA